MKFSGQLQITLDKEIVQYIRECAAREHSESYLIAILHKIQGKYNYLSEQHMQEVAELLNVPAAQVSGVATFYHFFRLKPQGKYKISVCMGTACYVKGSQDILDALKELLGIQEGETTADGMFSLEIARCIGVCGLAPAIMINNRVYGKLTKETLPALIRQLSKE